MKKNTLFIVVGILFSVSCSDKNTNKQPSPDNDKKIFYYNEKDGISSLDPAESNVLPHIWICNLLYNGLVQSDDSLNVLPCIAKSWEIEEDGTKYIFHLRNDVYFHDNECFPGGKGRKVVAYDFEFSFNRLLVTPNSTAVSLLAYIDKSERTNYRPFQSINDSTFVIYLKQPYSVFLHILTMKYFSVIPYEAIDYYKKNISHACRWHRSFHAQILGRGQQTGIDKKSQLF
ncbi:MAG: hypothetical protein KatS3mg028_0601 [Bacteroidia bacterium]|nr:MAG: hypothetical protein KatS3mg028_0601 [Bacteroidia bacterium]